MWSPGAAAATELTADNPITNNFSAMGPMTADAIYDLPHYQ
jgi:hypothetical protein